MNPILEAPHLGPIAPLGSALVQYCHASTKISPFHALYRRDLLSILRYEKGTASVSAVDQLLEDRDIILDVLRMRLTHAEQQMKSHADNKRHHAKFQIDDQIYLKLWPYRQRSLAKRKFEKLAPHYYGPFRAVQKIERVAYKLELPSSATPALYLFSSSSLPPQLTEELQLVVETEALLAVRPKHDSKSDELEVLLRWKNLPDFEATTWEEFLIVRSCGEGVRVS